MGDSTYEYMIKLWLQSGKKEQRFRDMWDKSMNGGSTKIQKNNLRLFESQPIALITETFQQGCMSNLCRKVVLMGWRILLTESMVDWITKWWCRFCVRMSSPFPVKIYPLLITDSLLIPGSSSMLHGWGIGNRCIHWSTRARLIPGTERPENS